MGTYTHINLHEQSSAIELLPAPPPPVKSNGNGTVSADKVTIADSNELDAFWSNLSEEATIRILSLANHAK